MTADEYETITVGKPPKRPPGDYTPTAREVWWLCVALGHVAGIGFGLGLGTLLTEVLGG